MSELKEFIDISKYVGERYDLVQAGGGNTSVKTDDGKMYIKASGYLLSEIDNKKGFSIVNSKTVLDILNDQNLISIEDKKIRDSEASRRIAEAIIEGDRPSIETFLHSLLYKYTSHVHAIAVNCVSSRNDWQNLFKGIEKKALCIKYKTPGMELAVEMKKEIDLYVKNNVIKPKVIFLQNHGLIISSDSLEEIEVITEDIVRKSEKLVSIDLSYYKNTTKISKLINSISKERMISYLSENKYINNMISENKDYFFKKPFYPDGFVYCGYKALEIDDISNKEALNTYLDKYKDIPKIIVYDNNLYIIAKDLKKAKLIEDVLKNNLMILKACGEEINFLDKEEISYLGNWEAEKYRQNK